MTIRIAAITMRWVALELRLVPQLQGTKAYRSALTLDLLTPMFLRIATQTNTAH